MIQAESVWTNLDTKERQLLLEKMGVKPISANHLAQQGWVLLPLAIKHIVIRYLTEDAE